MIKVEKAYELMRNKAVEDEYGVDVLELENVEDIISIFTLWKSVKKEKPEERSLLRFKNGKIVIGFYKQSMNAYFIERSDMSEPQTVSANCEINPVVEWKSFY